MTRRRFYVPRGSIREDVAALPSDQAHHLRDVLRMESGDVVEIFDGAGRGYTGEVQLHGPEVLVRRLRTIVLPESPFRLTLAAALIKPSKFEWMLEKATELGVDEIIPLRTRNCGIQIPEDKIEARLERWRRILTESAKQCRRFAAPSLRKPESFPDLLQAEDLSGCAKVLFDEEAVELWKSSFVSDRMVLCIGPEGGWDPGEIEQARKAACKIFGLGPRVLRAETAAIAAVSIIRHQIDLLGSESPG